MSLQMEVSGKPWCLKKCHTESACSTEIDLEMDFVAEAAFCEDNPQELIKKSAMGSDWEDGSRVLETDDEEEK